jgi:sugar phosphate isomerase/epimerase
MPTNAIGIDVDDLRLRPREALRRAAELAFRAVELSAMSGDVSPASLGASGRRHLSKYVDSLGLTLAALSGDLPGLRLTDPRTVDERVDRTCEILQLAADVGVPVVTASVGALAHPQSHEPSALALDALRRIGEFADSRRVSYAIRPSHDPPEGMGRLLETLCCPALRLCLDPASLVMTGINPVSLVERLPGDIVLVHARDGTAGGGDQAGHETRLGEGDVDVVGLLSALRDLGYAGPYILRRTDSVSPADDLHDAREALKRLLAS